MCCFECTTQIHTTFSSDSPHIQQRQGTLLRREYLIYLFLQPAVLMLHWEYLIYSFLQPAVLTVHQLHPVPSPLAILPSETLLASSHQLSSSTCSG